MVDTPCGCDLIERAKTTRDRRVKDQLLKDGEHFQAVWKCPRRAVIPKGESPDLPPAAVQTLEAVQDLTGAEGLQTCPMYFARLEWVGDVVRLRRWFQKGQLHLREPHPPGPLVDAIDCLEDAVAMREAWEVQRATEAGNGPPPRTPGPPPPPGPPKP